MGEKKKQNPKRSKNKRKKKRNGLQGGYRAGRTEKEHRDGKGKKCESCGWIYWEGGCPQCFPYL